MKTYFFTLLAALTIISQTSSAKENPVYTGHIYNILPFHFEKLVVKKEEALTEKFTVRADSNDGRTAQEDASRSCYSRLLNEPARNLVVEGLKVVEARQTGREYNSSCNAEYKVYELMIQKFEIVVRDCQTKCHILTLGNGMTKSTCVSTPLFEETPIGQPFKMKADDDPCSAE